MFNRKMAKLPTNVSMQVRLNTLLKETTEFLARSTLWRAFLEAAYPKRMTVVAWHSGSYRRIASRSCHGQFILINVRDGVQGVSNAIAGTLG